MMVVETEFSMSKNLKNKGSWHGVISFEMTASRSERSEEAMFPGKDGDDYMVGFL